MPGTTGTAVLQAQLAMNDHYQRTLADQLQANQAATQMRVQANQNMWDTINKSIQHVSDIAVERQMIKQRAEQQAIRDKQINEYELGKIREYGIRDQALETLKRTGGISEGAIAHEAALTGRPIDVVRQEKFAAEQERQFQVKLQQKDQELRQIDKTKLSLADLHKAEDIAKIDLGITQIEGGDFSLEVKQRMIAEAKAKRQGLLMGIELPPAMSIQQQVEANTYIDPNGTPWTVDKKTGAVMVPRGYKPPEAGNNGTPKSLPSDTRNVGSDDVTYQAALKRIVSSKPKPGLLYGTNERTVEEATPEEIQQALTETKMLRAKDAVIQGYWLKYLAQGIDERTAMQYAERDYREGSASAKGKLAQQQAEQQRITDEYAATHGIPKTQPAPEQAITQQFEDEATGQMVTFVLKNGQWVRQ